MVWVVYFALASYVVPVKAQQISKDFQVEFDVDSFTAGVPFQVSYSTFRKHEYFYLPEFEGVYKMSGPNVFSESQMVENVIRYFYSYTYVFLPLDAGELLIPAATFKIDDKELHSNAYFLQILDNPVWDKYDFYRRKKYYYLKEDSLAPPKLKKI